VGVENLGCLLKASDAHSFIRGEAKPLAIGAQRQEPIPVNKTLSSLLIIGYLIIGSSTGRASDSGDPRHGSLHG